MPETPASLILVVDDEPAICWAFERMFSAQGHEVLAVSSAEKGLEVLEERIPDLILLDVRLPQQDGISALPSFHARAPETPVIIMTAFGDLETAVSAVKQGATDYITKPFDLEDVQRSCQAALRNRSAKQASREPAVQVRAPSPKPRLVGSSPAMQRVFKQIALVADSDLSVLITGETGTGKELVAAAIHQNSPRREQPYLPIAPVALNPELIESELFGHVKGAFTGAERDRPGVFEQAERGTVFLDEIGDLPLAAQVKLLRVLDQREYFRVGDVRPRACNIRILAATNCDLQEAVEKGEFREDLYFRLNGLRMHLPPLRERKQDILPLCQHFLSMLDYRSNVVPAELLAQLEARAWHGNVRELRNAVEHAAVLARGRPLTIEDFPEEQSGRAGAGSPTSKQLAVAIEQWFASQTSDAEVVPENLYEKMLAEVEPTLFRLALQQTNGNRSKAAELLGIHRATLREKLKAVDSLP